MKVVINKCNGGFGLSKEACELYTERKGFYDREIERNDPVLIEVVEQLGDKANGNYAKLSIVDIPDDVEWCIEEYDGIEWVSEVHRTWS